MKQACFALLQLRHQTMRFFLAGLLLAATGQALAAIPSIAAGYYHSIALKADGSVWAWGSNITGQIGDGTAVEKSSPVQVLPPGSGVIKVAAGRLYSLALKADGSVWAWGQNAWGQIGDGTNTNRFAPVQVLPPGSGVINIVAGRDFILAIKADGSIWAWGFNDVRQLGETLASESSANRYSIRKPFQMMEPGSGIVALATGMRNVIALKADGSVWGWGDNQWGQLGDGTEIRRWPPVQVMAPDSGVIALAAGNFFSLALKADGSVWSWGNNYYGQLGNGTLEIRHYLPGRILSAGSGVVGLAAGLQHSVALKSDGSVWAWGLNNAGQLGDGSEWTWEVAKLDDNAKVPKRLSPVQVLAPGSGVTTLSAANDQSLALKSDGSVLEWGNPSSTKRWVGMTAPGKLVPTPMPAFSLSVSPKEK